MAALHDWFGIGDSPIPTIFLEFQADLLFFPLEKLVVGEFQPTKIRAFAGDDFSSLIGRNVMGISTG